MKIFAEVVEAFEYQRYNDCVLSLRFRSFSYWLFMITISYYIIIVIILYVPNANATHFERIERCNGWIPAAWPRSWGPSSKRQTSRGRTVLPFEKRQHACHINHPIILSPPTCTTITRSLDFLFVCHLRPEYATVRKHSSSVKLHPPRKAAKRSPVLLCPIKFWIRWKDVQGGVTR